MTSNSHDDFEFDNFSIQDVLRCWNADDEDSIGVHDDPILFKFKSVDAVSCKALPSLTPKKQAELETLMRKYPDFVPQSLPCIPLRRQSRPLCIFINFMAPTWKAPQQIDRKRKIPYPSKLESHKISDPSNIKMEKQIIIQKSNAPEKKRRGSASVIYTASPTPATDAIEHRRIRKVLSMSAGFPTKRMHHSNLLPTTDVELEIIS